ncbi:type VII secretion integral membrane protein EccD [Streptomyces mirabilis]|uniref:type VII secretion integral membrane protein EccD n=1 Tax=Streptomyces mirabilis TaxID=68239 RepID=UPI0036C0DD80
MSVNEVGEMCRLVVVAPGVRADVAVPAGVTVSDLLPALLRHAGSDLADAGLEHGGWVLQRLGDPPLDEDRTPAELGLRDGDLVTLRPRDDALPEMDFDDLVDGIATGIRSRPDRWREEMTRRLLLGLALAALAAGCAALLPAGPAAARAAAAAAVAALLILAAGLLTRIGRDRGLGIALGTAALPYAALAGALAAGHPRDSLNPLLLTGYQLPAAAVCTAVVALLVLAANPAGRPAAVATAIATAAAAGAALPVAAGAITGAQAAAALLTTTLVATPFIPTTAFRLARLRTTALPTGADDLGEDIEPIPADPLLAQVRTTDTYMTALFTAVGGLAAISLVILAPTPGWAPITLTAAACAVLLLRSRVLLGGWQRLATLAPAVLGLLLLAAHFAATLTPAVRLSAGLGGLAAVAAALLVGSRRLPGHRMLPYWGRGADIAETFTALSLMPLLGQVFGLYGYIRDLVG